MGSNIVSGMVTPSTATRMALPLNQVPDSHLMALGVFCRSGGKTRVSERRRMLYSTPTTVRANSGGILLARDSSNCSTRFSGKGVRFSHSAKRVLSCATSDARLVDGAPLDNVSNFLPGVCHTPSSGRRMGPMPG